MPYKRKLSRRELLRTGSIVGAGALIGAPGFWRRSSAAAATSSLPICFTQNGHVYQTNPPSDPSLLSFGGPLDIEHCALGPDTQARYIVAVVHPSDDPDRTVIILYDRIRQTRRQLVPDFYSAGGGGVDWFPTAPVASICFAGRRTPHDPQNIYRLYLTADGAPGPPVQLTNFPQDWNARPPVPGQAFDVSVSRDGTMIAYSWLVFRNDGTIVGTPPTVGGYVPHHEVWVMTADGSQKWRVSKGGDYLGLSGGNFIGAYDPTISPDKTRVVYSITNISYQNDPWGTAHDLWISPIDGSAAQQITAPGPISIIPDWYGDSIVYTRLGQATPLVLSADQPVVNQSDFQGIALVATSQLGEPPAEIRAGGFAGKFVNTGG